MLTLFTYCKLAEEGRVFCLTLFDCYDGLIPKQDGLLSRLTINGVLMTTIVLIVVVPFGV